MDYQKIYNRIIEKGQLRILPLDTYFEKHHIIPKCMGGSNSPENLVKLTAREHFLCHWLLARLYPNNGKIIASFWQMCISKNFKGRYTPPSRAYEEARINHSKNHSLFWKNRPEEKKEEKRKRTSILKSVPIYQFDKDWNFIKEWPSLEEAHRILHCNIHIYLEGRSGLSANSHWAYKEGYVEKTPEEKQIIKEKWEKRNGMPILQFSLNWNFIKEWSSVKKANKELHCDISAYLNKRQLTAANHYWKRKSDCTEEELKQYNLI